MRRRRERALATAVAAVLAAGLIGCSTSPPAEVRRASRVLPDTGSDASPLTPASGTAPGSGPLGLKWNWAQYPTLDFVASAGGGWTFYEIEWCDVQPALGGSYDWTTVDRFVSEARDLGHETMLKLRTGQCWATESPSDALRDTTENAYKDPSTPTTDLAAYLAFVRTAVRRYAARGVDDYAIENEPDTANHWAAPIPSYRRLAVQVARTIHDAHPRAHVLDGGTSSTAYGVAMAAAQVRKNPRLALQTYRSYYARRIDGGSSRWPQVEGIDELRDLLRSAPARRAVRAVDVGVGLANSGVVDAFQLHYYEPTARLPALLRFLDDRLRDSVAVEAWEVGVAWPGDGYDERRQADEAFRLVGLLLGADIRRVVYLPVAYTPAPAKVQVFRGLTTPTGALLPAGSGWLHLAGELAGLRGTAIHDAAGRLHGVTWTIGRRQTALLWARRGPVRLDPSDVAQVIDATGTVRTGAPIVGRRPVLVKGSPDGQLVRGVRQGRY